jgi:putative phosphoribosyl transferase
MFGTRSEAGKLLARELYAYKGEETVVLALARGGVEVAYEIAKELESPLDTLTIRKVGHPLHLEYAIGAVYHDGQVILDPKVDADARAVQVVIEREQQESARRAKLYRGGTSDPDITDKRVIIVDDGIATGMSMKLAVAVAKKNAPKEIVVATPVAPESAVQEIEQMGARADGRKSIGARTTGKLPWLGGRTLCIFPAT